MPAMPAPPRNSRLALSACSVLVVAFFGGTLYRRVGTRLVDNGVLVPGFKGPHFHPWSEFTRESGRGVLVKLHTGRSSRASSTIVFADGPNKHHRVEALFHARRTAPCRCRSRTRHSPVRAQ
jgi:hypothetical protein